MVVADGTAYSAASRRAPTRATRRGGLHDAAPPARPSAGLLPVHASRTQKSSSSTASRPRRLPPGTAFFAVVPSRHRYYLPEAYPGWTFGCILASTTRILSSASRGRLRRDLAGAAKVDAAERAGRHNRDTPGPLRFLKGLPRLVRGRARAFRAHALLRNGLWRNKLRDPDGENMPTRRAAQPGAREPAPSLSRLTNGPSTAG